MLAICRATNTDFRGLVFRICGTPMRRYNPRQRHQPPAPINFTPPPTLCAIRPACFRYVSHLQWVAVLDILRVLLHLTTVLCWLVITQSEALRFPHSRETKPIEQAKRNAAWLADYLRNETGEPVEVFPLVVLPGWFVKKTERVNFRVNVINANYLPGFLARQAEKIAPPQVRRIITALDKKCRDVEF